MGNVFEQVEQYRQQILIAHFKAFGCIRHKVTKGDMRERAIRHLIQEEYPSAQIVRGVVADDASDWQSPQIDIILLKHISRQGIPNLYHLADVIATCEVKTNASSTDFKNSDNAARTMKEASNSLISTRMFAFATQANRNTLIKSFGFRYDKALDAFDNYDESADCYQHIDYFISIDASEEHPQPYLITKDIDGTRSLFVSGCLIQRFLELFSVA